MVGEGGDMEHRVCLSHAQREEQKSTCSVADLGPGANFKGLTARTHSIQRPKLESRPSGTVPGLDGAFLFVQCSALGTR